ncbi:MAG: hypothetical protein NC453_27665 [Muribaculum sp.]|nr:hypothetical protein [Muribaculum sp.]
MERVCNPNRKRAHSRDFIEVEYTGYGIVLYPLCSNTEVSVTGVDNFTNIVEVASEDNGYFIETGVFRGIYEVRCSKEDGSSYSGILEIND